MSVRVMSAVWDLALPPSEKLVLLALADWAHDDGRCWPSIKAVAEKSGVSERTVQRMLREAEKNGLIERKEVVGKGCEYRLNPRHSVTPDKVPPVTTATKTPDTVSPNTLRTVSSEASASSPKARKVTKFPAPPGVPDDVWNDFLASPQRRKAGMSGTAYAGIFNNLTNLAEHGFPPGEMIALAVERGWKTVKLEWVENEQTNSNRTSGNGGGGRVFGPRPDPTLALLHAAVKAQREDGGDHEQARTALPARQFR